MQHPSTPGSVPPDQPGRTPGVSDEELAAELYGGAADLSAYPVAALLARHWQPVFDYAALCAPSAKTASMLATAAFSQVLDNLARNGVGGAVRPQLLVTTRHIAKAWARDPRVTTMLPGLSIPEPPAENRQLVSRAFHAMPMVAQVLLWHAETEAEGISIPAGLLGLDPRLASDQLEQAREQFRGACVRTHREYAPTGECRHYNRLLDISLRRGGSLIPDIQVHLSECRYCGYAADQLDQSGGRLGVLLAEALLGGAAAGYLGSRPGRRRQARLKDGGPDAPTGPDRGGPGASAGRSGGRHSRSPGARGGAPAARARVRTARTALPELVLRGRRAAVERPGPTALGLGTAVVVTGVLVGTLVSLLWSDETDHTGATAPSGAVTGTAPGTPGTPAPDPSATSAGSQAGPLTLALRNIDADLCVDFAGGEADAGADVLMAACSTAPSQRWVYERDGRLRSALAPGLCLDSRSLEGILVAGDCTGRSAPDAADVRYDLTLQGEIVPRWNEGLAVVPAAPDAGSPVAVKVRDDSPAQRWATNGAPRSGTPGASGTAGDAPFAEKADAPDPSASSRSAPAAAPLHQIGAPPARWR
ncbi:RICIN domain-containing protein [Streptomyces sp. NPDC005805]|uniref:RICIN domain-containing protein n=1 Tax=Streptomyces sp. NPDC005805 TaxID=3157068 RepID=UPI0033FFC3EF